MRGELVIVALLVGLGTWLFRFLPLRLSSQARSAREGWLERFFQSTGPAAIATLLVASLLPSLTTAPDRMLQIAFGCVATVTAYRITRSVALATLAGAAIYGVAFKLMVG